MEQLHRRQHTTSRKFIPATTPPNGPDHMTEQSHYRLHQRCAFSFISVADNLSRSCLLLAGTWARQAASWPRLCLLAPGAASTLTGARASSKEHGLVELVIACHRLSSGPFGWKKCAKWPIFGVSTSFFFGQKTALQASRARNHGNIESILVHS